ncbi:MAG TPA: Gfo/Idh/MocA family oxidoreductase [Solirubrobacteraceae bacterium]|nr:Gfo/Idh/MocA family oxidoreductase [Solirubrobacteraceae bacterium]
MRPDAGSAGHPERGVAIVGLGYWGPNLLRNAWSTDGMRVIAACDRDSAKLAPVAHRYPTVRTTRSYDDVLAAADVDAVIIATPVRTHYELAREALLAGKHVFVEKPLAQTSAECRELIRIADERSLVLMPGHTFLYSPPARKVKELLDAGELGELFFGTFSRVNLGIHQSDASVLRDLGPHDFSMLLHWLGEPTFVRAIARDSVGSGQLDVAFIDLGMPSGALVHMEFSWLAPTKLRRTVLVGSERMIVYEDTSSEQVRVFDRGVEVLEPQSFGEHQLSYRSGDILTPRLDADEPLGLELQDFLGAMVEGRDPVSSAKVGLDVVRIIEAAEHSLEHNASPVGLTDDGSDGRRGGDRRRSEGGMPAVARLLASDAST